MVLALLFFRLKEDQKILFPPSKTRAKSFLLFLHKRSISRKRICSKVSSPLGTCKKIEMEKWCTVEKRAPFRVWRTTTTVPFPYVLHLSFILRTCPSLTSLAFFSFLFFFFFFRESIVSYTEICRRPSSPSPSFSAPFVWCEGGEEKEEGEENGGDSFPPFSSRESRSNIFFSKNIVDLFLFSKNLRTI